MPANWRTKSLSELCVDIWATLARSPGIPDEPWRLPSITTINETGPQVRTVVLREVTATDRRLMAWTDRRSAKVAELRRDGRTQWLFSDALAGLQLRAGAVAQVHHDDAVAAAAWAHVPPGNRSNYAGVLAPGAVIQNPTQGWELADDTRPDHFAVIAATVTQLDWLWLDDRGQRRARFVWRDTAWSGEWLVP